MYTTNGKLIIKFEDGADGKAWVNQKCDMMVKGKLRNLFNSIGTYDLKQSAKEWVGEFEYGADSPMEPEELYKHLRSTYFLDDDATRNLFKGCDGYPTTEVSRKVERGELVITIWVKANKTKGRSQNGSLDMMSARAKVQKQAGTARRTAREKAEAEALNALENGGGYTSPVEVVVTFNNKEIKDGKAAAKNCGALDKALVEVVKELNLGKPKWVGKWWWIAKTEYTQNDGAMDNEELANHIISKYKSLDKRKFDAILDTCSDLKTVKVWGAEERGTCVIRIHFGS